MNREERPTIEEVRYDYPKKPWPLPVFCCVFLALLLWRFCVLPLPLKWTVGLTVLLALVTMLSLAPIWDWPRGFLTGEKGIVLDADGLTLDGKCVLWDKIKAIKPGPFRLWRSSMVRLKVEPEKAGFLRGCALFWKPPRKTLTLPGYPVVYRHVIPAILRVRPHLDIPPAIRRCMDNPQMAGEPGTFAVIAALFVSLAFLTVEVRPSLLLLVGPPYLVSAFSILTLHRLFGHYQPFGPNTTSPHALFLRYAIAAPSLYGPIAFWLTLCIGTPLVGPRVVLVTCLIITVLGLAVVLRRELSSRRQWLLAVPIVLTALAVLVHARQTGWRYVDVTRHVPGCNFSSGEVDVEDVEIRWGEDGLHLCRSTGGLEKGVLHVPTLTSRPVPRHTVAGKAVAMNKRFLVRTFGSGQKRVELWVYDFQKEEEFRLAEGQLSRLLQPLSPDGQKLAWTQGDREDDFEMLRIWDLPGQKELGRAARPPGRDGLYFSWPRWKSDDRVILWAHTDAELFAFHYDVKGELVQTLRSRRPGGFHASRGLPDGRHALGLLEEEDGPSRSTYAVHFLDAKTGRRIQLDGVGEAPYVIHGRDIGFRVKHVGGGRVLTRFQLTTGREQEICGAPARLSFAGVSANGELALFGPEFRINLLGWSECAVVHVPTARTHRIRTGGTASYINSAILTQLEPGSFPISPTGRWLKTAPLGWVGSRVLLYDIPPDWRGN